VNYLPIVVLIVLALGMYLWTKRTRQRAAYEEAGLRARLSAGSPVMTTSGLYGTIESIDHADDTVQLVIAKGITVTWALAALRDAQSLPDRYRSAVKPDEQA
jgi:preprotein translocase subunit YajC